jgi:hypothetical protein
MVGVSSVAALVPWTAAKIPGHHNPTAAANTPHDAGCPARASADRGRAKRGRASRQTVSTRAATRTARVWTVSCVSFRYMSGSPPGVGRISFFGLRTLYPLCTLWGVACAKTSDSTPIRAGVVGKFSGRVPVHGWVPARSRKISFFGKSRYFEISLVFTVVCVHTLCVLIKSSDSGREPSRVPELGQKTFRLPPPEWGSNRKFSRRLPPIMYKGGIMYATQKRKFFRLRAGFRNIVGNMCPAGTAPTYTRFGSGARWNFPLACPRSTLENIIVKSSRSTMIHTTQG